MKQHVSWSQLKALPKDKAKILNKLIQEKYRVCLDFVNSDIGQRYYETNLYQLSKQITIGRMIEILRKKSLDDVMIYNNTITYCGAGGGYTPEGQTHEELCDNLWEAVKEVL